MIASCHLNVPLLLKIVRIICALALRRMAQNYACLSFPLLCAAHVAIPTVVATIRVVADLGSIRSSGACVGSSCKCPFIAHCAFINVSAAFNYATIVRKRG